MVQVEEWMDEFLLRLTAQFIIIKPAYSYSKNEENNWPGRLEFELLTAWPISEQLPILVDRFVCHSTYTTVTLLIRVLIG